MTRDKADGLDWQPIETAPRDMTEVIGLHAPTKTVLLTWYFAPSSRTFGWLAREKRHGWWKPTHWMPFGSPPAEKVKP